MATWGCGDNAVVVCLSLLIIVPLLFIMFILFLPAWRAAQVGTGVPVPLERQPATKAPKTQSGLLQRRNSLHLSPPMPGQGKCLFVMFEHVLLFVFVMCLCYAVIYSRGQCTISPADDSEVVEL